MDAVWCWDIPYIWAFEGFVYLTSIMDLFSRKILAWVFSDTLEAKGAVEAVEKAKAARNVQKPKIIQTEGSRMSAEKRFKESLSMGQCMDRVLPFPNKKGMAQPV